MISNTELIKFSNVESKLTFDYSINFDKKGNISSLTFYHKLTNSTCNINFDKNIFNTLDLFIDNIKGKIYGTLIIEPYKNINNSYTYLMFDGINYKIGRSINPEKRFLELRVASPNLRLLKKTQFVAEKYFHELFWDCNVGGEWFNLNHEGLQICHILFNTTSQLQADMLMRFYHKKVKTNKKAKKDIKDKSINAKIYYDTFMNTRLPFGKYKGLRLKDLKTTSDIQYLKWFYQLPDIDKPLKVSINTYLDFLGQL